MKFSDKYSMGSPYLKPVDLPWTPFRATITGVYEGAVGPMREDKYLVYFSDLAKPLVLTPTNAGILAQAFGDDTAGCVAKVVDLVVMSGSFDDGKVVDFIRIEVPAEQPQSSTAAAATAAPSDDDIPF